MARTLFVIGHGRSESLGHRLLATAREVLDGRGLAHRTHDLLADGFDPVLRLAPGEAYPTRAEADDDALLHRYQCDVVWCDAIAILHPVWWFGPPAVLKGWVDRVLVDGVALSHGADGAPVGLLGGRRALVVQTYGAPRAADQLVFRGMARTAWKRGVLGPVGIRDVETLSLHSVDELDPQRLERFEARLRGSVESLVG